MKATDWSVCEVSGWRGMEGMKINDRLTSAERGVSPGTQTTHKACGGLMNTLQVKSSQVKPSRQIRAGGASRKERRLVFLRKP
jgi:hypothetical protein